MSLPRYLAWISWRDLPLLSITKIHWKMAPRKLQIPNTKKTHSFAASYKIGMHRDIIITKTQVAAEASERPAAFKTYGR